MDEELGVIGKVFENDLPVVYSFIKELPENDIIVKFPTLVVISWEYDGSNENGYPDNIILEKMYRLEGAIEIIEESNHCYRAYGRTGNNLKELAFYTTDQESFMLYFNEALKGKERYPIDIKFYQDKIWADYKDLLVEFKYG